MNCGGVFSEGILLTIWCWRKMFIFGTSQCDEMLNLHKCTLCGSCNFSCFLYDK